MDARKMRFYDPLYGVVELTEFEYSLIFLPEVQRLRYVRMCNINSLLITGASEISRFEHVLGVMCLAKEWVKSQAENVSSVWGKPMVAAAVLHDMQTGPFGHSFQYVVEDNEIDEAFKHEDLMYGEKLNFHQMVDANVSFSGKPFGAGDKLKNIWTDVTSLIKGEGEYGPLISGTIDLDNIDNVVRLAYHVGIASKRDATIALSLAKNISCHEGMVSITADHVDKISQWQIIRKNLYRFLLLDWAEFSAKAMLTKAIEIAVERNLIESSNWKMTDDEFLEHLIESSVGENQEIGQLVKNLRTGDLYTPLFLALTEDIGDYPRLSSAPVKNEIEARIKSVFKGRLGVSNGFVVHFIKDKGKTERSIKVYLRDKGECQIIGQDSCQLLIGVFSSLPIKNNVSEHACYELIKEVLGEFVSGEIKKINDPLFPDQVSETQLELL
ncbi:hypothetical protein [Litchfieldella anticariensis]|nr:hypothetical protein [Halomonas anticariensis]